LLQAGGLPLTLQLAGVRAGRQVNPAGRKQSAAGLATDHFDLQALVTPLHRALRAVRLAGQSHRHVAQRHMAPVQCRAAGAKQRNAQAQAASDWMHGGFAFRLERGNKRVRHGSGSLPGNRRRWNYSLDSGQNNPGKT